MGTPYPEKDGLKVALALEKLHTDISSLAVEVHTAHEAIEKAEENRAAVVAANGRELAAVVASLSKGNAPGKES